ncbi:MAG: glycosyltransferase family 1 protein [Lapillicoccus sp.]
MSRRLGLNGKWLAQELTGTQRYAREMTRHLLPLLSGRPVLHVPADAVVPDWLSAQVETRRSRLSGMAFEQLALPLAARRELLLSLGGPAPVLARLQVVTMHDATPFRLPHTYSRAFATWYRFMYRAVARRASRIITVSAFSRDELADVLHTDPPRFVVVPNGVGHVAEGEAPVRPAGVPDAPFALMVGPAAAHKNIAPVAAAVARLGIEVVVVGGGGSQQVFGGAVGSTDDRPTSSAGGTVHRLGRVTDAEVAWLYAHAGVLVFPSLYEGFGLPVVEAQRAGCPVVASDRASLPEVAGLGALLVDPTRPDEVAAAVERVLGDPGLADALRAQGHTNAERFSWEASAAVLSEVLAAVDLRVGAGRA